MKFSCGAAAVEQLKFKTHQQPNKLIFMGFGTFLCFWKLKQFPFMFASTKAAFTKRFQGNHKTFSCILADTEFSASLFFQMLSAEAAPRRGLPPSLLLR